MIIIWGCSDHISRNEFSLTINITGELDQKIYLSKRDAGKWVNIDSSSIATGELVINAASAAKVIPAKQTADLMSGMGGGGQNFAPTTIVNSAPTSTSMVVGTNSLNPISQKYFRN